MALVPWLFSVADGPPGQVFLRGYVVGFLFFEGTIWWIAYVTVPGFVFLVAFLALYFAVWSWFANRLIRGGVWWAICLGLPAGWAILEFLRSILLSGFGWNLLAHTQWHWIRLIQIASLTGAAGVSFLVVLVNGAVFCLLKRIRFIPALCLAATLLAAALVYSFHPSVLQAARESGPEEFTVAVVQGNIPQPQKWDSAFQEAIWKRYEALTRKAAEQKPDLIIWPETSVPDFLDEPAVQRRLGELARASGIPMLVGVPISTAQGEKSFNSAVLIEADGTLRERYDKIHLVPFGEYVPLEPLLGWLRRLVLMGTFSPGHRVTVFAPSHTVPPFSVLICFEDLFPGLCREFVRRDAHWLLVITNDGWFRRSAASLQHLQASVFRAVENRVWIGRAANTGWSGFISPMGRLLPPPHQVPRFRAGVAVAKLAGFRGAPKSPYVRWGNWFPVFCLILLVVALRKGYNKAL